MNLDNFAETIGFFDEKYEKLKEILYKKGQFISYLILLLVIIIIGFII